VLVQTCRSPTQTFVGVSAAATSERSSFPMDSKKLRQVLGIGSMAELQNGPMMASMICLASALLSRVLSSASKRASQISHSVPSLTFLVSQTKTPGGNFFASARVLHDDGTASDLHHVHLESASQAVSELSVQSANGASSFLVSQTKTPGGNFFASARVLHDDGTASDLHHVHLESASQAVSVVSVQSPASSSAFILQYLAQMVLELREFTIAVMIWSEYLSMKATHSSSSEEGNNLQTSSRADVMVFVSSEIYRWRKSISVSQISHSMSGSATSTLSASGFATAVEATMATRASLNKLEIAMFECLIE